MAVIRYTREQLLRFRDSPLAQKPDNLPSIEQWMDLPDQNQRAKRTQGGRNDEQAPSNENGQQRPSLLGTKSFHRTTSAISEDIVLGPSKSTFTSASRIKTLPDMTDKAADEDDSLGNDRAKDRMNLGGMGRFGRDRDGDRLRDRNGTANGRFTSRDEGEGWNAARSRKSFGPPDEGDRAQKNGDKDRDRDRWSRFEPDTEGHSDSALRRNGMVRGRSDHPWGREDSVTKEGDTGRFGAARGGWRDRERRNERQWGSERVESDPEWMDTPTKEEKKKVHTQEDFQKWKERMKAGTASSEEKTEPEESAQTSKETAAAKPSKPATPLALEGAQEQWFGKWGDLKKPDVSTPDAAPTSKLQQTKATKASRFKGFFAPAEAPAAVPDAAPAVAPSSPPPAAPASDMQKVNDEDRAGFDRILSMLSGANLNGQSPQPQKTAAPQPLDFFGVPNAAKPSAPPGLSQLRMDAPADGSEPTRISLPRSREGRAAFVDAALAPRGPQAESKPKQLFPFPLAEQGLEPAHASRPEFEAFGNGRLEEPTPRKDTLHELVAGQRTVGQQGPPPRGLDSNSQFLLNLMSQSRGPSSQQSNPNLNPLHPTTSPLDALSRMEKTTRRMPEPEDMLSQYKQQINQDSIPAMASRRQTNPFPQDMRTATQNRPPPSYYDEPSLAALQRRSTNDAQPRPQMTNMGIPQQPPTMDHQYMMKPPPGIGIGIGVGGGGQQDRGSIAPPPGFGAPPPPAPHRQPPGFGFPNMPPQSQPPPSQPQIRGGMGPGAHMYGGQMPPPGPPGFFGVQGPPPPGFAQGRQGMPQEAFLMQQGPGGLGGKDGYGLGGGVDMGLLEELRLRGGRGGPHGGFGM